MPKIALISDIHANLQALEMVLNHLDEQQPDYWVCLGDIVGYGGQPAECVSLLMERDFYRVKGNHDAGVTGELSLKHFREPNRSLIAKTKELLNPKQIEWLKNAPLKIENSEDKWVAAHASPMEPDKWTYLESAFTVRAILSEQKATFCFVGHTHQPSLVSDRIGLHKIIKDHKYLINPGSVGQSRDKDYRASCGLLDTDQMNYHNYRLDYDISLTVRELKSMNYNREDIYRLMRYKI